MRQLNETPAKATLETVMTEVLGRQAITDCNAQQRNAALHCMLHRVQLRAMRCYCALMHCPTHMLQCSGDYAAAVHCAVESTVQTSAVTRSVVLFGATLMQPHTRTATARACGAEHVGIRSMHPCAC